MKLKQPRNKFEQSGFDFLKKKRVPFGYEVIKIPYIIEGTYNPDFYLHKLNRVIEFKGHFRPEDKRKMRAVKTLHPDIDLRIVFYKLKKDNIKWCERHGFPWAIGAIPEEWLKWIIFMMI